MPVIIGTSNPEVIAGTADSDEIYGRAGGDSLLGGGGDDIFYWETGDGLDHISGEAGGDMIVTYLTGTASSFLGFHPDFPTRLSLQMAVNPFLNEPILTLDTVENLTIVSLGDDSGRFLLGTNFSGRVLVNGMATPLSAVWGVEMSASQATYTTQMVGLGSHLGDRFFGSAGNDIFYGYAGDDLLDGKGGSNELVGGPGDDTYRINSLDTLVEVPGEGTDTIIVAGLALYGLRRNFENLTNEGSGTFNGFGNEGDNILRGSPTADDRLYGLDGNDQLFGGSGPGNELQGGLGDDLYVIENARDWYMELANQGRDTVATPFRFFTLPPNFENLTSMPDFNGTDTRLAGNSVDNVISGHDLSRDYLIGLDGNDRLEGLSHHDILDGGAGDDLLIGGAGADEMAGGAGADMFVVSRFADGVDGIHDFSRAEGDRIDITAFTAEIGAPGVDPFASGKLILQNVADFAGAPTTRVLYDPDGSAGPGGAILFLWAHGDTLTSADFIF